MNGSGSQAQLLSDSDPQMGVVRHSVDLEGDPRRPSGVENAAFLTRVVEHDVDHFYPSPWQPVFRE